MANFNFDKYLTHRAVLSVNSVNAFGDVVSSSPTTVACFYYYGPRTRQQRGSVAEESLGHYLLLPNTVTAGINYAVTGIVDNFGTSLAPDTKIAKLERYTHWQRSIVLQQATLELN